MSSRTRWFVVALALAGLGLSFASLWVHYRLLTDPTYVSPCDVSASFNCSQVYLSQYGSAAGVPVAFGGVIWFGLVGLIAAFAQTGRRTSTAPHYLLGLSVVGIGVIAYLAYASMFVLRTGCLLCMGTYACVLAIAALTKFGTPGSLAGLTEHLAADVTALPSNTAGFVAGLAFLGGIGWAVASFPTEASVSAQAAAAPTAVSADARTQFADAWVQQPRVDLGIAAEGAEVLVVKFNDYECPTCRQGEIFYQPVFDQFAVSHPGAVQLVFKDYPLNAQCNVLVSSTIPGHEAACIAAAAARVAAERDKFDEMTSWIWMNQGASEASLRQAATRILEISETELDREYLRKLPAIRQDIADGGALNISGTPTYFINGVRLPSAIIPVEYFRSAVELELEKAEIEVEAGAGAD
jgi:uncharacterized membrane protein